MDENHRIANDFENLLVIGDDDNHNRQENVSQINTSCENCGHGENVTGQRDLINLDNDVINLNEIENRDVGNQEQNLGRSNSNVLSQVVNRQKNTEEDIERSGVDHKFVSNSPTKINGFPQDHLGSSNVLSQVVNRQKSTEEDIERSGVDHQFVSNSPTKINDFSQEHLGRSNVLSQVVNRQKSTEEDIERSGVDHKFVSNSPTKIDDFSQEHLGRSNVLSQVVNRQKSTEEDIERSVSGHQFVSNSPTKINGFPQEHLGSSNVLSQVVNRQKTTEEDIERSGVDHQFVSTSTTRKNGFPQEHLGSSNVLSQVVNRQKNTEEDIERSGVDHQFLSTSTTRKNGFPHEHPRTSNLPSEVVNRQKNTEEDIECSGSDHQFTQTNTTKNGSPQIQCYYLAWKLLLNVHSCTQKAILDHLDTSEHSILWNNTVVFGRGEEVNFFINDEATSRKHVELVGHILSDGQARFMIRNASNKKMIYFNKQRIKSNSKWIPLKTEDEIAIAGLVFTIHIIPGTFDAMFSIQFDLPKVYGESIVNPSYSNIKYKTCNHETNVLPEMQVPVSPHQSYHYTQPYPNLAAHTRETPREEPIHIETSFEMVQNAFKPYEGEEGYIDLANLEYIALEVVDEWKELGRVLGLLDWQVTIIDNDYRKIAEKSYQMMKTWVYLKPHEATLENLGSALKHLTVKRRDLAKKYCNIAMRSRGERNGHN